mgnify:CR=1 FL=1
MSYLTQLRVRNAEGALERVLGVVRIRGFAVQSMSAQHDLTGQHFDLTLRLKSDRPIGRLSNQLSKLVDVESLELFGKLEQAGVN